MSANTVGQGNAGQEVQPPCISAGLYGVGGLELFDHS